MHLKVRSKLLLLICVPLIITYGVMLVWDYTSQRARARETVEELVLGRANLTVGILDTRLAQVQQLATIVADALEQRQERIDPAFLRQRILGAIGQFGYTAGVVVALEPDPKEPGRKNNAVIRRTPAGVNVADLPEGLNYDSPDVPWYWQVKQSGEPHWFPESNAAGIFAVPTIAYSMPLMVDGEFHGVISVHVLPTVFRRVRVPRARAQLAEPSAAVPTTAPASGPAGLFDLFYDHYIVAQRNGDIIYHFPEQEQLPHNLHDPALNPIVQPLYEALGGVVEKRAEIVSVHTKNTRVFTFEPDSNYFVAVVPIRGGDFAFITSYPEADLMNPVYENLGKRAAFLLAGLVALLGIIYWAARRISRPIEALEHATQAVAKGNLHTHVPERGGSDEIATLSRLFNSMLRQLREQVARIREESEARARVENELQLARQIQTELLPRTMPVSAPDGRFELHATNLPANHVAGDYYDFFVDSTGRLTLVIADVAGHGVAAALMMAVTRTLVRSLAATHHNPVEIAYEANRVLLQDNPSSMFVTLIIATYEPTTGALTIANAGHPVPLILRRDGHVETLGTSTAPLLGVFDFARDEFAQMQAKLEPGDTFVLYTDGITEAMQASTDQLFGQENFVRAITGRQSQTLEQLQSSVVTAVQDHQQRPLSDDLTLLLLRRL